MATWPSGLPQKPLLDGFSEGKQDIILRTEMDVGPAKRRRRYTWAPARFAVSLVCTTAQVATFETFVETTLNGGVDAFDWTHPRTGAAISLAIIGPYQWTPLGAGYWRTTLQLEEQA